MTEVQTPSAIAPSRRLAVLLTLLVAFGPVSTDLYLASLPDMARALKTDVTMVQLTLSAFIAGFAVMQLAYGPLSDRFGRRRAILGGIAVYVLASLFCVFAPSIETLIAGRFFQALGACCGPVVGRAVVRDLYPREAAAKVLSYMASAMALAPFVAPMAGGWLHSQFGWRSNFVLLALFGIGLGAAVWHLLEETNRHPDPQALDLGRMLSNYGQLFRNRTYMGYVVVVTTAFSGMFTFISGASFVLIDMLGLAPEHFGFGFCMVVAGYMSGGFVAGRLTHTVGLERMVGLGVAGCALTGVVGAVLAYTVVPPPGPVGIALVLLPMMAFFFCAALVLPNSTAGAITPFARMAGTASAGIGFVQMTGGALAGWGVAHLFDGTHRPMALVTAGMGVLALLAYISLVRPGAKP